MSLLLDLLKTAHTVYKNMEDTRKLPYVDSFIPSIVPRGLTSKAHILGDPFKLFCDRRLTDHSTSYDLALATEILKLKYPDSEKNAPSTSASSTEVKDDSPDKKKLEIILSILRTCANLESDNIKDDLARKNLDEIKPHFEAAFAGVEDADYFILTACEFVRLTPDLKNIAHLNQRFVDTEIECGQKTRKIAEIESKLLALERQHKELEQTLAQMSNAHQEVSEQHKKLLESQKQYDIEIIDLKQKLYGSEKNLTALEHQSTLDNLTQKYEKLKLAYSQSRLYTNQVDNELAKQTEELDELRKINAVLIKQQGSSPTQSSSSSGLADGMKSLSLADKSPALQVGNNKLGGMFSSFKSTNIFNTSTRSPISSTNSNAISSAQILSGQQQTTVGIIPPTQYKPPGFGGSG
jgi:hypothetical protein